MVESSCGPGFLLKASQMIRVAAGGRTDNFEGDFTPQSFIARPENLAHRANADLLEYPVMSYNLADHARPNHACWHVRFDCLFRQYRQGEVRPSMSAALPRAIICVR